MPSPLPFQPYQSFVLSCTKNAALPFATTQVGLLIASHSHHTSWSSNYKETFAPVAKMTTVRALISIAASQSWHLFQTDVNSAFLLDDLKEVYMRLPPGVKGILFQMYVVYNTLFMD